MGAAFDIVGRIISTLLGLVLGLTGAVAPVVWSRARKANDPRVSLGGHPMRKPGRSMRTTPLPAIAVVVLSGCTQTPRDLLTSGAWTCVFTHDIRMELTFGKDGKLGGKIKMADPSAPPDPQSISSVSLDTGGSWALKGDSDLTFDFSNVKLTEGKRGSQDLEPAEAEFFVRTFEGMPEIEAKITSISSAKMEVAHQYNDTPMTCSR